MPQEPYLPSIKKAPKAPNKQVKQTVAADVVSPFIRALRTFSIIIFCVSLVSAWFFGAAQKDTSQLFSLVNMTPTGQEFQIKHPEIKALKTDIERLGGQVQTRKDLANQGIYSDLQPLIREIEAGQRDWFNNGDKVGIASLPVDAAAFLSSNQNPDINLKNMSTVTIDKLRFTDDSAQVDVTVEHLFGKIFTLAGAFNDALNGSPWFSEGEIQHFRRQNSPLGDEYSRVNMEFTLSSEDTAFAANMSALQDFITKD